MVEIFILAIIGVGLYLYQNYGGISSMLTGNLSAKQIAEYASTAGFTGSTLITAVAIALSESSGNPSAYNPETAAGTPEGKGSYGLWQIYLNAHPEFEGLNLNDPQINANCAYQIYLADGFSAWSTYNSNAYLAQVSTASTGVNS